MIISFSRFYFFVCISCALLLSACTKESDPPIASFTITDNLDHFILTNTSKGDISHYKWHYVIDNDEFILKTPLRQNLNLTFTSNTTAINVSLTVKNNVDSSTFTESIHLSGFCRKYGLGKNLSAEHSNNRSYEWYIDQGVMNCGHTCAAMIHRWLNPSSTKTVEEISNTYPPWSLFKMRDYLRDNEIDYVVTKLFNEIYLKDVLNQGNVALLAIDLFGVRKANASKSEWRIDRFFPVRPNSWHWIIVKGFKIVDEKIWFEVYDPGSGGVIHPDGFLIGRDRYYGGEDIMNAVRMYSENMFIIIIENPVAQK